MITLLEFKLLLENYREALQKRGVDKSIIDYVDTIKDNKDRGEAIAKLMRNPKLTLLEIIPEKKFRSSDPRIHAFIQTVDPSRDMKYYRVVFSWIQNGSVQTNNRFAGNVKESLGFFHENKKFFDTSYLNKYETFQDFWRAYEKALKVSEETERKKKERELQRNAPKIFEDSKYKVYEVRSYEASCILGKGTKWCTASRNDRSEADQYLRSGPLYIFVSKSGPSKYQLYIGPDHDEFNDHLNNSIGKGDDADVVDTALDCFMKNNMLGEFIVVYEIARSINFEISSRHKNHFFSTVTDFSSLFSILTDEENLTHKDVRELMTRLMSSYANRTVAAIVSNTQYDYSYNLREYDKVIYEIIDSHLYNSLAKKGVDYLVPGTGFSSSALFVNILRYLYYISDKVMGHSLPSNKASLAQNTLEFLPARYQDIILNEVMNNPVRLQRFLQWVHDRNKLGRIARWPEIEDVLRQDPQKYMFYFKVYPEALENEEEMDKLLKRMSFDDLLRQAHNKMDSNKHREAVKSRIENGVSFSRIPPEMFPAVTRYLSLAGLRSIQYLKNILALEEYYNDALNYVLRADRTEEAKKVLWNSLLELGFYRPIMEYVRIFLNGPDAKFESWLESIQPIILKSWMQKSDFAPDLIRYYAQKYNRKLPDRVVNEMPYYYAAEYATKITGQPVIDDDLHQQIMASTARHLGSAVKDYQHRFGAGVNQR